MGIFKKKKKEAPTHKDGDLRAKVMWDDTFLWWFYIQRWNGRDWEGWDTWAHKNKIMKSDKPYFADTHLKSREEAERKACIALDDVLHYVPKYAGPDSYVYPGDCQDETSSLRTS